MHEDSKTKPNDIHTNELPAPNDDEKIARMAAELLQAVTPAKADQAQQVAEPVQGARVPAKTADAVIDAVVKRAKEMHSEPDVQSDEEEFRKFFQNTAVVVPKEMQAQQSHKAAEKKSVRTRLQGLFAQPAQQDEEEDDDEALFFPIKAEEPAARGADVSADGKEEPFFHSQAKPTGKVHFAHASTEPAPAPAAPVHKLAEPAPAAPMHKQTQAEEAAQSMPKPAVQAQPDLTEALIASLRAEQVVHQPPTPQVAHKTPAPMETFFTPEEWAELSHAPLVNPAPATKEMPTPVHAPVAPWPAAPAPAKPEAAPEQAMPAEEEMPAVALPVPAELLATPVVMAEQRPFEDLSQETAFLREACEQQKEPKETFFTRTWAKVQDWKEAQAAKRLAAAQPALVDQALQAAKDDFFAPLTQGQDAAASVQNEDGAQGEQALDLPAPQEEMSIVIDTVDATDAAPEMAIDQGANDAQESAPQAAHEIQGEQADAEEDLFVSLQSAFTARVQQEKQGEGAVVAPPVPQAAAVDSMGEQAAVQDSMVPAPEQTAVPEMVLRTEEADLPEITLVAQETDVPEIVLVAQETDVPEIVLVAQETDVPEIVLVAQEIDVPEITLAAQEVDAPAQAAAVPSVEASPLSDVQKPNDYCLFDQAADEAAAEAQIGQISFVDAVPYVASVVAAQAFAAVQASADADAAGQAPTVSFAWAEQQAQIETAQPTQGEGGLPDDTRITEGVADATQAPPVFEDAAPAEKHSVHEPLPEDPEGIQFGLSGMRVRLFMRTFTTGVFAIALFLLGLMAQGVLPAVDAIDPTSAPVPFLLVNLALMLAAAGVSYPVFIDGVTGLWGKPSPDTLPALAGVAALLQLLLCLAMVESYQPATITLFSALAGLALFADALGSLVMALVMQSNFNLASAGVPHYLAYHLRAKDTQRTLTRGLEVDDPALLLSRPVQQIESFLEKSFSPRASDKRAQWAAYGLLGGAVLACLIAVIKGQSALGAMSSVAGVLCIGVPLSVTLLAALPSVFLQRAAAKVGAVVPGWQSIEALGDINLIAVDGADLFPPMCAQMHGIKTFQKERVDLAILYATSILVESCDTLQTLFASMIDYKTELLYPVKDLAVRGGLGFIGWCENYRVILGTRALMQAEGVPVPALDYENRYTKEGKRQVLYLSVSGQLYAMFVVGYRGEKNIARALRVLRKERIRLLVRCSDPTLTAHRIEEIYHLPAGFITLLSPEQSAVMQSATDYRPKADGCMLHLGNFASLVGGLKAASGAAQVERSASAIQLVWAGFSVLLCLFLCLSDGLMQVPLAAILLYQMAWCVINLGVVFTKKFE